MKKILTCLMIICSIVCFACIGYAATEATFTYEFEDASDIADTKFRISASDSASGGKYVNLNGIGTKGEHSLTISTKELDAGVYNLELFASVAITNDKTNADMYLKLDGGDEIKIDSSNSTETEITPTYPNENYKMSKLAYKSALVLSQGKHTITVVLKNSEDKAVKAALDCLKLTKENLTKITDGYIRFEAEDAVSDSITSDSNASGGKVFKPMGGSGSATLQFKFMSDEAGEYIFEAAAAEETFAAHLSPVYFTLNDGDEVQLSSANVTNMKDLSYNDGGTFPVKHLKYKTTLNVKEGMNTLTVRVAERRNSGQSGLYVLIDWVDLRKVKSVEELTIDSIAPVKKGAEILLPLKNENGEKINSGDLDSFDVIAEDGMVAEFANGKVYARCYGKTNLKITAVKGGKTFKLTAPIEVISEKSISISDASRIGNTVSFKLNAYEAYAGGDKLIIAVYNRDGDMLTSVASLVNDTLPSVSEGECETIQKELDGLTSDAVIAIFIMSQEDEEGSIYAKTVL